MRLRHTQREEPIDEAGGEVEAGDPLEGRGDEHRQGGEQRVHHVQREGGEHEGELQGFGHTGEEGGQTTGEHQGADGTTVLRLGAAVDGKRARRQAEHHDREEAGLVHAGDVLAPRLESAGGQHGLGGAVETAHTVPELGDVVNAGKVEPEHVVEGVVQTRGDEQTVEEGVDAGTDRAHAHQGLAEGDQTVVDQRPHEQQHQGNDRHQRGGQNRHAATAGEEGQEVGQLGLAEAVVQRTGHAADHDAEEHVLVADGAGSKGGRRVLGVEAQKHRGRAHDRGDGHETDQTGQGRGAVLVTGHADGHANGEQQAQIVEDRRTRLAQIGGDDVAATPTARIDPIADAQEERRGGQAGDGQHQRAA